MPAADGSAARHAGGLRRRRFQCDRSVLSLRQRCVGSFVGVEAGGLGLDSGQHAASLSAGVPGVLHGNRTYLLEDDDGQIIETHSVSAGLDYPGVGPEHAYFKDIGRADYVSVTDDDALSAFRYLTRVEGIMPALESSHAIAWVRDYAPKASRDEIIIVNLSGRGDKDILTVAAIDGISL